jgi:hypothetical protein
MEKKLIELIIKTLKDTHRALLSIPNHKLNIKGYKDIFDMAQQIGVIIHKFEEENTIAEAKKKVVREFLTKIRNHCKNETICNGCPRWLSCIHRYDTHRL